MRLQLQCPHNLPALRARSHDLGATTTQALTPRCLAQDVGVRDSGEINHEASLFARRSSS